MSPEEAIKLCRLAKAASPAQAVDEYTPELWALSLQRERFVDAQEALIQLAREQEWIHLSHIVKRVKKIRDERLLAYGPLPDPPSELEGDEYSRWLRDTTKAIADGALTERPALPSPDPDHKRRMGEMIRRAEWMQTADGDVQLAVTREPRGEA